MWALWAASARWTETDAELGVSVQKHETRLAYVQSLFPEQEAGRGGPLLPRSERGGNTTRTFSRRPNVTWAIGQFAKAG